ncbi:hypothetical protein ACHAWF_002928 [Thalassiosira exigua]
MAVHNKSVGRWHGHRLASAFRTAITFSIFSSLTLFGMIKKSHHHHVSTSLHAPHSLDKKKENYEIVTTNFGWTTATPSRHSRRKISREFFDSILSHPRYNATAWEDLESNPDPSRRLVAFVDIDTCIEGNYPVYGPPFPFAENMDIAASLGDRFSTILDKSCKYIKRAAESPALAANKDSRLVLLDCGDGPYYNLKDVCGPNNPNNGGGGRPAWGDLLKNSQVIIAYYGIKQKDARPFDIGIPPPAIKPVILTPHERHWIKTCKSRSRHYLFSFQGRGGFRRDRLKLLENQTGVYINIKDPNTYWHGQRQLLNTSAPPPNDYDEILRDSLYAAAPRGDCLWSYRFTEIMSAGSIPVVYSNDWLRPFSSSADPDRVMNWTDCAVFPNENHMKRTLDILHAIPDDVRCKMQQCSLAFWDKFASSRAGWLEGILRWVNNDGG